MQSGADQGYGASGWEQDEESEILGTLYRVVQTILADVARVARERPMLAATVAATLAGAVAGAALARRARAPRPLEPGPHVPGAFAARSIGLDVNLRRADALPRLLPPLVSLLGNPIVQGYLRRAIARAISMRLSRHW